MFNIVKVNEQEIQLSGRLDATQVDVARPVFEQIKTSALINCADLAYISSAGLGLFVATQRRLSVSGGSLTLTKLNKFVRDVFRYSSLDKVIKIEEN